MIVDRFIRKRFPYTLIRQTKSFLVIYVTHQDILQTTREKKTKKIILFSQNEE